MTQPSLVDLVLDEIPIEYRDRYAALHARADEDLRPLARDLDGYVETVRQVAAVARGMDFESADRLARSLRRLIDAERGTSGDRRRLVAAAVVYFVEEEDDDEITGVLGFDDDVQVVNAVARVLGREDLVVTLGRH